MRSPQYFSFQSPTSEEKFQTSSWRRTAHHCLMHLWLLLAATFLGVIVTSLFGYVIIRGMLSYHASMPFHNFSASELAATGTTGIAGPLISTMLVIFIVIFFSAPLAIGCAIFVVEYGRTKWWARLIVMFALMCNGIPSIVFCIMGMLILVQLLHLRFSILSTAIVLTLVILPTLFIGVYESLKSVKNEIRYESFALGATKFQTMRLLLLRAAIGGIINSFAISLIRAIGESAPVLFTIGGSNLIPHSVFDSGNTLTLLLFQQFQGATTPSFLYSIAFVIFLLMIFIYVLLAIAKQLFVRTPHTGNQISFFDKLVRLTDIRQQGQNLVWIMHRWGWQIRSLFII